MNILITSAARRTYLIKYFRKALNGNGIVHAANSILTPTLLEADRYVLTPSIYDNNYIDFLISYCKENSVDALISVFDIDLPVLAAHRDCFEKSGVRLLVSDYDFVKICNDKFLTADFFESHSVPTPKAWLKPEDAIKAIASGNADYPLIIKPRFGMGSIGIMTADNEEELRCFYNKCFTSIRASYLKYESAAFPDDCVMIQEYIDGQEYGIDIINDLNGNFVNAVIKKKIAMRSGETDIAETVEYPLLRQYAEAISKAGRHIANLDCDVLVKNDKAYFIEINARFGGGYPFSHAAGINLPKAIVAWLEGEDGQSYVSDYKTGVRSYKDIAIYTVTQDI